MMDTDTDIGIVARIIMGSRSGIKNHVRFHVVPRLPWLKVFLLNPLEIISATATIEPGAPVALCVVAVMKSIAQVGVSPGPSWCDPGDARLG